MSDKVNVLGTIYTIEHRTEKDDKKLEGLAGYTDVYKQLIIIRNDWNEEPNKKNAQRSIKTRNNTRIYV